MPHRILARLDLAARSSASRRTRPVTLDDVATRGRTVRDATHHDPTHRTVFHYCALRRDGSTVVGMIEALSPRDADDALARQGLFPVDVRYDPVPLDRRVRRVPRARRFLASRLAWVVERALAAVASIVVALRSSSS